MYSGGLDNAVKYFSIETQQLLSVVGSHDAPVRCIEWLPSLNLVASAGWDSTLRLWDPRTSPTAGPVSVSTLPGKAFSMSASDSKLVIATSGRHIEIYSLRSLTNTPPSLEQRRESSLKFQTRCIRCFPSKNGARSTDGSSSSSSSVVDDQGGYALSSVEGRVGIEYFSEEAQQAKKYAFKCHRKQENGKDVVYPVNAIAFNSKYGTFATGGCDGVVSFWDGANKKRLHQVSGYPTSVAALAFNDDASMLAVAASYTHERGEVEHPPDAIYLRRVEEVEVLPRQKQPKN